MSRTRREAPRSVNRRALLLHRAPYGETSLVVEVLSPQDGVRSVLARGAFRPTSRFYAVLDWFDTLELDWRERRGSDLALLDSGDRCVLRRRVATNLAAYRAAHAALDSIRSAARAGRKRTPCCSRGMSASMLTHSFSKVMPWQPTTSSRVPATSLGSAVT